jgi:molybdopterin converting factor small subunit
LEPPKEAQDASVVEASRSDQKEKTNVTVLYFASIRTHLKVEQETYQTLPTLVGLKDEIIARHPDPTTRSILEGSMWSVGDEMVDLEDDVELKERDVVAVIPPVSGG